MRKRDLKSAESSVSIPQPFKCVHLDNTGSSTSVLELWVIIDNTVDVTAPWFTTNTVGVAAPRSSTERYVVKCSPSYSAAICNTVEYAPLRK